MSHLGDRVAPLIDGQLPMDASERAMTHMASCPHCQESADLERLTKQRLASLGSPRPRTDFVQQLLTLGVTEGPVPPAPGGYLAGGPGTSVFGPSSLLSPPPSGSPGPGRGTPPAASRSPRGRSRPAAQLSRSTRSRLVLAAASAACLVGVGVAGGVAAAPATAKRQISPPVDSLHQQPSPAGSGLFGGQTVLVGSGTGR